MERNRVVLLLYIIIHLFTFENCFLFSVIIAIYNSEKYLDECIESLIFQTIGFKKIQIILINDGSTDHSENICIKYQNNFKENILYIKIKHSGVSKARNVGLNFANGTFINFLDADDKWDYQAFNYISLFLEKYNDINLVAGRIKFFEAQENYHPLDYKFYKTRIVNLSQEYTSIQLSASSSILRKSAIKGKYFNEDVYYCEDSRFINSILLLNPIMGLIKEAIYFYRRRNDFSSAINNQNKNLEFYFGTINNVSKFLINSSISLFNCILPFIQFLIIYDLFWRIQSHAFYFLSSKNFKKYKLTIEGILEQIDDKYIIEQKIVSNKYKIFVLSKKYHRDLRYDIKLKNSSFMYSNYVIIDLIKKKNIFDLRILNIKNNVLYLEAIDNLWLPRKKYDYFIKIENRKFYPKYLENSHYDFYTMYGMSQKGRTIIFEIPLQIKNKCQTIYFYISYMDENSEIFISLGLFSHIPPLSNGYFASGNFIIKYHENRLNLFQYNEKVENQFERQYCFELHQNKKEYIINLRKYVKHKKKFKKNYEIWIINDRQDKAGDNGEFFFRYLNKKKPKGIKPYFVIEKKSRDYKRLKNLGNILALKSERYKKIFAESNKIISSISDEWTDNPYNEDKIYIRDLLHFDFILLNNGIMKNDLSNLLNRFDKNYSLIIISSKSEFKSIMNFNYGYNKNNIFLAGMSRFDNIIKYKNAKKNTIAIIPLLREVIKDNKIFTNNKSKNSILFNSNNFYEFYNDLINDKKLLLFMKKYNYKGLLCISPNFEFNRYFIKNEQFSVLENCDYQSHKELLLTSSLLVTDYSNIFLDFGYLKKPIIFAHFDYEQYKIINPKIEFFNYQRDGFGQICKDLKCTIKEIIFHIENCCLIRKKYMKRIKLFFEYSDNKNNERILYRITNRRETKEADNKYNIIILSFINFFFILLFKFNLFFIVI